MQKETRLQEVLRCTLESLRDKEYSEETLKRYQKKFHLLDKIAQGMNIHEPSEELFNAYLNDCHNKYTGEYSILKERQRIRVVNLIKSYIINGEVDSSRKKGKSVSDRIKTNVFNQELNKFVLSLEEDHLRPNTISTYRRIVAYLLLYCEKKKYHSVNELIPGDIRDFILHLYDHGYFKPSTITSGLSGLKRFLSLYPQIKHLSIELPSHLPRERKIMEIYSEDERAAINSVLSEDNNLTKRDKAISLLLLETGLRGVDVCNIRLDDIDWYKDVIKINQQKTGHR